jgi:hypothetical protein
MATIKRNNVWSLNIVKKFYNLFHYCNMLFGNQEIIIFAYCFQ